MNKKQIVEITRILTDWNPLGIESEKILDETGYETEATDILFHINSELFFKKSEDKEKRISLIVNRVLNEAFNLNLTGNDCKKPAHEIYNLVK